MFYNLMYLHVTVRVVLLLSSPMIYFQWLRKDRDTPIFEPDRFVLQVDVHVHVQ